MNHNIKRGNMKRMITVQELALLKLLTKAAKSYKQLRG